MEQDVALTGRNTTGPPSCAVTGDRVTLHMRRATDDDDAKRQRPLLAPSE